MTTWQRIDDGRSWGYRRADGAVCIYDNGAGLGRAAGNGRWAVELHGKWLANVDTLADAKVWGAQLPAKVQP